MEHRGLKKILWCIPLFLMLHNIEEALTMPEWIEVNLPMLQERIPLFQFLHFSTPQLYVSLTLVTLIPFIVTMLCLYGELTARKTAIMITLQSIVFWNALMPHVSGALILGMYNPGTITALLFNIPFSLYTFTQAGAAGFFPKLTVGKYIITGAVIYLPIVYFNHLFSGFISRLL